MINEIVSIEWTDTLHKDDLMLSEVKQLKPVRTVSYGRLMVLDDVCAVIADTIFPDEDGTEYRDCSSIPRSIITKITKLEVKQ